MRCAAIVLGLGAVACGGGPRSAPAHPTVAPRPRPSSHTSHLVCPPASDLVETAPPFVGHPDVGRRWLDPYTETASVEAGRDNPLRSASSWHWTSCVMRDGTFHGPWRGVRSDGRVQSGELWYGCPVRPGIETRPCETPAGPWPYWHDRPDDPE